MPLPEALRCTWTNRIICFGCTGCLYSASYLAQTGFHKKEAGSVIDFISNTTAGEYEELVEKIEPRLEDEGMNYDTVESQKEDTNRSLSDLRIFIPCRFYCLVTGMHRCGKCNSYLCKGKNKYHSHYALPWCTRLRRHF